MRLLTHRFRPSRSGVFVLVPIGDAHIGSAGFSEGAFKEDVKTVLALNEAGVPTRIVTMGDLADSIHRVPGDDDLVGVGADIVGAHNTLAGHHHFSRRHGDGGIVHRWTQYSPVAELVGVVDVDDGHVGI